MTKSPPSTPSPDHLADVTAAVTAIREGVTRRNLTMATARANGHPWSDIANAASMTPNGVRYALRHAG